MPLLHNPSYWLLSAVSAEITGAGYNLYAHPNFAYLVYAGSAVGGGSGGASAILNLEGSHDGSGWMVDSIYTATATQTGTAQIGKFYPFVRGRVSKCFSAIGGTGTGVAWMHFTPGAR